MRKSISPVVAVVVIVAVVALAVGAYLLSAKRSGSAEKVPGMKGGGGSQPNPNALLKGGKGGPGAGKALGAAQERGATSADASRGAGE